LLIDKSKIVRYNFIDEREKTSYIFTNAIEKQPDYVVFDPSQQFAVIASIDDALWVDLKNRNEIDIDEHFKLSDIKALMYSEGKFYCLANRHHRKLGYFLLELDVNCIDNLCNYSYVIKWQNKLSIGDGSLESLSCNKKQHAIVVSFKTIYENTYTVLVIDRESYRILFKHNSYQLWESPTVGFINTFNNDFIILNKEGTSVISLSDDIMCKSIQNTSDGVLRMFHSLNSASFLKVEKSNMITFESAYDGTDNRKLRIQ